jgi:hypothetical protein
MAITTTVYAVQAIFKLSIFDLETDSCFAILEDLKQTNWMNNGQTVYAQGAI